MSGHHFRCEAGHTVIPIREWIRRNCKNGREGLVVTDLDLVLRTFDPRLFGDEGEFRLCEHKSSLTLDLDVAQFKTFKMLDRICRRDPKYQGFYLIRTRKDCFDLFDVNGEQMSPDRFQAWIEGHIMVQPFRF